MLHKSFQLLEMKAEGDSGEFTAIVSTFGNIDKVGDRIVHGAYTKTLQKWQESGDPLPIILAHQWNDPWAHIGYADTRNVSQTEQGLQVTGKLDIGDNPVAKQVYKLMKGRRLKEFSIGYDVPPGGEKRAKDGANEITEINLAECGPCLIGIDPKTELQSVKSALDALNLPDAEEQRKAAERVAREEEEARLPEVPAPEPKAEEPNEPTIADLLAETLSISELEGIKSGELKAVWTTAYVNDLPDSAFLYVEPGGEKDADGKTAPRSLRHFPYKDANGTVDLPHLRNALSRIPQSSLPQDVKDRLTAQAQRILDNQKSVEVTDVTPKARSVDPLREQAEAVALEFASDGLSLRRPPKQVEQPKQEPEMSLSDLKDRMREEVLVHLSGDIT
jgi:HK97 family phage prohead protease